MSKVSRRGLLAGSTAALAVAAFDPVSRRFLSTADAQHGIRLPRLDGELVFDPASRAEMAEDFGGIVSSTPRAVLRPGSERDIQRLLRFCNARYIPVAMRGQGHSCLGEAQVDSCGVIIDSRTLNQIHSIDAGGAVVDAGVTWRELTLAALAQGLTPLILTDYLDLSVGGVLSVGGIGGNINQVGSVADNVLELNVVKANGRKARCSDFRQAYLFDSVLGGLGQFGLITRATIPLGPAPALARIYELEYSSLSAFLADQRTLVNDARFDYHEGQIIPGPNGTWAFRIEVGAYYTPPSAPDDAALLAGLSPDLDSRQTDYPYFVWLDRVSFAEQALRNAGLWDTPNPWSDLFLPDSSIEDYLQNDVLPFLTPDQVGAGLSLIYPFRTSLLNRPFMITTCDPITWAFDILRFPFVPNTQALLDENRRLYDAAVAVGGTHYPVGALELSGYDWFNHYGPQYFSFVAAKGRFDRRNILTPGQGIF